MGPLQKEFAERRETGLNSEYGMDKWKFIAKKQGWGLEEEVLSVWKITKRKH